MLIAGYIHTPLQTQAYHGRMKVFAPAVLFWASEPAIVPEHGLHHSEMFAARCYVNQVL